MNRMQNHTRHLRRELGATTLLVVAFMGVFMLILSAVAGFALELAKYGRGVTNREQALHSAEAGLEYYRWFLAHYPNNLTNGTGSPGPYTYTVSDPEGASMGSASLSVSASAQCGVNQWIDITSVGKAAGDERFTRTLFARYMRQSVAAYSYVLNTSVWAGADRTITGPYFSNGGIRMDGSNNSDVMSAQATWNCTTSYGCNPAQATAPGVVGPASTGSALWRYPVASVDFAAIASNFTTLKGYAQSFGLYFAPAPGVATQRGYHLIFNSNGTVTVRRVTATVSGIPSYSNSYVDSDRASYGGWTPSENTMIASETLVNTYTIPTSCGIIFVDDHAWIEGTVRGKVTVVVATPSDTATSPSAYLIGDIAYTSYDGTNGLAVLAEGNVLFPLTSPDTMTVHGIFVAQSGWYGRNFYTADSATYGSYAVPAAYASYPTRTRLTTNGTVVSNMRTGTSWGSGGVTTSGYLTRVDAYDELQAIAPPPFTPAVSTDYGFRLWREN